MKQEFDLIIMGAGMVGASFALHLATSTSLKLALVDVHAPPSLPDAAEPQLRVSALSYSSEQLLRRLGAWQQLDTARLCPYRRLAVNEQHPQQGMLAKLPDISAWARTEFNAKEVELPHLGHIVENDHLQAALHAALLQQSAVTRFFPAKVQRFDFTQARKQVHLDSGECLQAKLIVGAEGAMSPVREAAKLGQFREQYAQSAFACTVACRGGQQDITWQTFRPEGPLAYLPLASMHGQDYASLVWYDAPERIKQLQQQNDSELLATLRAHYPSALPPLDRVVARGHFPLYKSHALSYQQDGVVLVGDAAHTINPLAGQGVNLGFMDVAVLAEEIMHVIANNTAWWQSSCLARYERRRRGANQRMMSMMDVFYYGFSNRRVPLTVLRNVGLGLAQRAGPAKRKVLRVAVGLDGDLPDAMRPTHEGAPASAERQAASKTESLAQ